MKKIIFLFLVLAILISGCSGTTEDSYVKPKADLEEPSVNEVDLPSGETGDYDDSNLEGPELSSEIKELLDKIDKVDSLEYSYSVFVKGEPGYYSHVYVKDNRMKQEIDLGSGTFKEKEYYDTVYFDLAKKTADAYCEEKDCDDRNMIIDVNYNDFYVESPFDVAENLKVGKLIGNAMHENKEVDIVEYGIDGKTVRVYIWVYRGLPLKYEVREDDELIKKVEFKSPVINDVDDEELIHQQLKN
ncbi:hypothetical protein GF361_00555 [Candidatus Woesearchaeota archaeon]|nr:hypothetical protein [Candidatus Woesearchaeota archaeon]